MPFTAKQLASAKRAAAAERRAAEREYERFARFTARRGSAWEIDAEERAAN